MPAEIAVQFAGLPQNGDQNAERRRRQNEGDEQRRATMPNRYSTPTKPTASAKLASQANAPRRSSARPISSRFDSSPAWKNKKTRPNSARNLIVLSLLTSPITLGRSARRERVRARPRASRRRREANEQRRENRHAGNRENTAKFVIRRFSVRLCGSRWFAQDSVTAKSAKLNRRP